MIYLYFTKITHSGFCVKCRLQEANKYYSYCTISSPGWNKLHFYYCREINLFEKEYVRVKKAGELSKPWPNTCTTTPSNDNTSTKKKNLDHYPKVVSLAILTACTPSLPKRCAQPLDKAVSLLFIWLLLWIMFEKRAGSCNQHELGVILTSVVSLTVKTLLP